MFFFFVKSCKVLGETLQDLTSIILRSIILIKRGKDNMTKRVETKFLFEEKGLLTKKPYKYNYGAKNSTVDVYWIDPNYDRLKSNWYLFLDDNINKRIHLFFIPPNSVLRHQLKPKSIYNSRIFTLEILYNDLTFTDRISNISFKKYYVDSIEY